jgi:hypothetical protein
MMNESMLTNQLLELARRDLRGLVVFKHPADFIAGIPDTSWSLNRITTWLEIKWANPEVKDRGIQRITMRELSRVAPAYYVIYRANPLTTLIVHPDDRTQWKTCKPVRVADGISHRLVVDFIRETHAA